MNPALVLASFPCPGPHRPPYESVESQDQRSPEQLGRPRRIPAVVGRDRCSPSLGSEAPLLLPQRLPLPTFGAERVRFTPGAPDALEPLRSSTYSWEALWWEHGHLSLRTFSHGGRGFELDCRLTCEPMLENAAGAELRLELGGHGRIPATHLFLRTEGVQNPRWNRSLRLGFGGL
ncbi:MAG: hypothetical protein DIU78_014795 [Pseudomonadota bacterium]|nr:MAG: hypothetical protein DIU78_08515 [Pseudomonadota bacterium]